MLSDAAGRWHRERFHLFFFFGLACLHMLWPTARRGSATSSVWLLLLLLSATSIETYEMQKFAPKKQKQQRDQKGKGRKKETARQAAITNVESRKKYTLSYNAS